VSERVATARGCFLVLDDDPVNRSLIRAILDRSTDATIRAATVLEAGSLAEARAVLAAESVDLLLLDVHLPDGLGTELAAEIPRGRPDRPAILALTASVLPADQQAALDAGCDAFLAKPYPAQDLVDTALRLLGERARAVAGSTLPGVPAMRGST
jgi:two-component system KDP operon response regulator KdpE